MEHADRGKAALTASNAGEAVVEYTKALIEHCTSPDYYTQRSIAFTRLKPPRHDLALHDAELGVLCGQKRGKRDKIQAAQQRRMIALYSLERYADSKFVLDSMEKWRPKDSKPKEAEHHVWSTKLNNKLKTTPQNATVTEYPAQALPEEKVLKKMLQNQLKTDGTFNYDGTDVEVDDAPNESATKVQAPAAAAGTTQNGSAAISNAPPQKIRHEWYQNNQSVIVTLYAKGVQKDKTEVDLQEDSISVSFPHPSDPSTSYNFTLDPLFALIDPSKSRSQVMSTKVELTLAKVVQGQKWANTEGTAPLQKSSNGSKDEDPAKPAIMPTVQQPAPSVQPLAAPSYPTSSKKGPKNWDKLADDLTAKKPKTKKSDKDKKSANPKDDSDSDADAKDEDYDSDMGGDAVDGFFKKLYAGADPDTRRAMMKSFTESNGTSLSTNWGEVGSKKVEEVRSKDDD